MLGNPGISQDVSPGNHRTMIKRGRGGEEKGGENEAGRSPTYCDWAGFFLSRGIYVVCHVEVGASRRTSEGEEMVVVLLGVWHTGRKQKKLVCFCTVGYGDDSEWW